MANLASIGAAVIGTGFIGTVHVEALRRIGVNVLRRARQHPGTRRRAGRCARRPEGLSHRSTTSSPTIACSVVHVTSPNDLHVRQAAGRPDGRQARRVREAAGDDRPTSRPSSSRCAAETGLVNATNFNIRYYPLNQHVRELVADGGLGEVRLVTGRYFQDWLLLDSDWNWRLQPDRGGALRAVGDIGSHWLDLMTFVTGQHVASVMADLTTFIGDAPGTDRPGRDVLDGPLRRDRRASHRDRGHGHHPAALRRRRAGRREHLPDQPRPEELARLRDRRVRRRRGRGTASSPTRRGSAIASVPTRSSSATRP